SGKPRFPLTRLATMKNQACPQTRAACRSREQARGGGASPAVLRRFATAGRRRASIFLDPWTLFQRVSSDHLCKHYLAYRATLGAPRADRDAVAPTPVTEEKQESVG